MSLQNSLRAFSSKMPSKHVNIISDDNDGNDNGGEDGDDSIRFDGRVH